MCDKIPAAKWELDMRYVIASTLTLIAVLLGIVIGILIAPYVEKRTQANPVLQSAAPVQQPIAQAPQPAAPAPKAPKINQVSPGLSAGTIGAYLFLAHHIQSDELVVNGFDVMKLQEVELELLSRFVPADALQKAVDGARVGEIYQIGPPPAPAP